MLGSRPKKMMNMYIYDILRRNTDAEHPMTQREIQKRLESEYDMTVDRKAVKANLEDLINDGSYNIEYSTKIRFTPNRSTGEIEKSEILTGFYYTMYLRILSFGCLWTRFCSQKAFRWQIKRNCLLNSRIYQINILNSVRQIFGSMKQPTEKLTKNYFTL